MNLDPRKKLVLDLIRLSSDHFNSESDCQPEEYFLIDQQTIFEFLDLMTYSPKVADSKFIFEPIYLNLENLIFNFMDFKIFIFLRESIIYFIIAFFHLFYVCYNKSETLLIRNENMIFCKFSFLCPEPVGLIKFVTELPNQTISNRPFSWKIKENYWTRKRIG